MVDTNGEQIDAEDLENKELEDVITDILPFLKKDLMRADVMRDQNKDSCTRYTKASLRLSSDIYALNEFVAEYEEFIDSDDEDENEDNAMFRERIVCIVEKYAKTYKVKVNRAAD